MEGEGEERRRRWMPPFQIPEYSTDNLMHLMTCLDLTLSYLANC